MAIFRRALVLGLAFGLAAATVEMWLNLLPFIMRRFGPGPLFFVRVALLQVGLGVLLGLVLAPLLKLPRGSLVHLLVMALCWYGLELWVELDAPLFAMLPVAVTVGRQPARASDTCSSVARSAARSASSSGLL